MKYIVVKLLCLLVSLPVLSQWEPAGEKIKTRWATEIDPSNVLNEYPRPNMIRDQWKNLNGLWDYAIRPVGSQMPANYDGKIMVPFAIESSLSGVMSNVGAKKELWYQTSFAVPAAWKGKQILLHFGAVDWKSDIWLNDIKIGSHSGGYDPFYFDITPFLGKGPQRLVIQVWDPSSDGQQPRGKQVNKPEGIWYTPVTGIWQTVWLEPVARKSIEDVTMIPDIDESTIKITTNVRGAIYGDIIEVTVNNGTTNMLSGKAAVTEELVIPINDAKLWSPESPFLYRAKIKLISDGKIADEVSSYFGMRKISSMRDKNGIVRLQLNNENYFQFGTLDQGWWPDGLYTAPTDEALKYDIVKTKELGFNMIRKHVKVEPARWYTHCDELGILVWQDMPNGGKSPQWQNRSYFNGSELIRSIESEEIYRTEWRAILDFLQSHPSIVVWVPFNEAWGQFKTNEIAEWTKSYDPSRLVNPASGGNHYRTGDMLDIHNYPGPELYLYDAERATVLGEYGGIGLPIEGHLWKTDNNWGYIKFKNSEEATNEYVKYALQLKKLAKSGFSAAIYTQTTDVEGEVNGLMTYDRKVDKLDVTEVRKVNMEVIGAIHD